MTVIAWDGKTLAADKRATSGGGIGRRVTKICYGRTMFEVLGITGNWDVGAELRAWYLDGAKPEDFPAAARRDEATLIVASANGVVVTYSASPYPFEIEHTQAAFGSGRDYAEAAMYLGRTAAEAIEVACHFQTDCGHGVDALAPQHPQQQLPLGE